ncbi:MAG: hypothetical protein MZV64_09155 [Ignavibacteriales bacterium]|nr:hypothetical protein [Ignavibacteriales bacterium]
MAAVKIGPYLMDIQLPGMSGIEEMLQVPEKRSADRIMPVIAVSSYAMAGDEEAIEAGCLCCITKRSMPKASERRYGVLSEKP